VYTPIELGALRSIRRNVVVTVLTRKSSLDFAFGSRYYRFRGKVTPSIVGSLAADRAQLTRRNSIRTQLDRTYANFLVGRVE
jgi:hypothetical protein